MFNPINFMEIINNNIDDCKQTLILGCGEGRHELELKGRTQTLGVDLCNWKLYLCREKIPVIKQDILDLSNFIDNSFDTVTLFDIIEHLPKNEALKLLKECERISKGQIIGFIPVEKELRTDLGELEKLQFLAKMKNEDMGYHLSLWTPEEMETLGYKTYYSDNFHGDFGAMICIKQIN